MNHKILADYGRGDSGDWFEQETGQKGEDLLHIKMIELRNPILVQRAFKKEFKACEAPVRKTILKWVKQFRSLRTIESLNTNFEDGPTTSGRPRVRTEEVIATVKESVENSPKRSLCHRAQCLGLEVLAKFWDALPPSGRRTGWFQQDGASCHCSHASKSDSTPASSADALTPSGCPTNPA